MSEPVVAGYKLIRYGLNQLSDLERDVMDLCVRGWQPIGPLQQARTPEGSPLFIQQMHWYKK